MRPRDPRLCDDESFSSSPTQNIGTKRLLHLARPNYKKHEKSLKYKNMFKNTVYIYSTVTSIIQFNIQIVLQSFRNPRFELHSEM